MCPDKVTEQLGHHRASQGIGDEKGHVNFAARKRRLQKLGGKPHPQPLSKRRGEVVTIRVNNLLTCQLVNSSTSQLVNFEQFSTFKNLVGNVKTRNFAQKEHWVKLRR